VVAHDKAGGLFLDRPRGREAAAIRHLGCVHLAKSQSSHKGNYSRVATAKATTVTAPFRLVLELDIGERLSAV